jgi:hypothetical protein
MLLVVVVSPPAGASVPSANTVSCSMLVHITTARNTDRSLLPSPVRFASLFPLFIILAPYYIMYFYTFALFYRVFLKGYLHALL